MSRPLLCVSLLLVTGVGLAADAREPARVEGAAETGAAEAAPDDARVTAADDAQPKTKEDAKLISGMSILGNQEAPKSLVIVPWKGSELGESLGISRMLDDSTEPVDKEVFLRALSFYEIRSETKP